MNNREPELIKREKIGVKNYKNYVYVAIVLFVAFVGISYGAPFFIQNKKIASGTIAISGLSINFTDRSISASGLSSPSTNQEGLSEYVKTLTVTNTTSTNGRVKLTLERTSGLALTDLSYALVINGVIQEIGDVASNGVILETAIMGNETINVELRLWPKTTYSGSETTFVGELKPEIKYLGTTAASMSDLTGKYVNFNCTGSTCEKWRIVKVEDGRLVLTRQADYANATSRTNSNKFDSTLNFNDSTALVTSVSTDKKNVYLAKTVKITGGDGTVDNPYTLENNIYNEEDKKVIAVITYNDGTSNVGTQNIYYNETNYISQVIDDSSFSGWTDGTNNYNLGDTINITSDTTLTPRIIVIAENVSHSGGRENALGCSLPGVDGNAQCVLDYINDLLK